jgi:TolA-binding protein
LKITKYIAFILLLCIVNNAHAQSKKDPWVKENWNNMIARFNIYFNADQKMQTALADAASKQKDDFSTFIPIYPYGTLEDAKALRPAMEEVMKKASKVIQNKPRSKWADDAYFLIGQTQFFSGDYFSSIETFQFVNTSYTDEDIKALSQLWLMKSYIQQGKYDDAEAIYGVLKDNKSTHIDFQTDLYLSAGDLLVKQNKKNEAIKLLRAGLAKLKNKTLRYRTNFVLGQLYLETKNYKKASESFVRVLKTNAPYEYVFQANLGLARSSAETGGQGSQKTKKYLRRMLDDDKNIDYYDQIYYELAMLEFVGNNKDQGLLYMLLSSSSSKNNNTQRTKTYLYLADYFFNERNYEKAQAYYDSTVAIIPEKYPYVEKVKAKHTVLSKLIENIETIRTQDSLIALSKLDRSELDRRVEKMLADEQEQAKKAKEETEIKAEQAKLNSRNTVGMPLQDLNQSGNLWYFYSSSSVGRGTSDFNRIWGNRQHSDFWRFINKGSMGNELKDKDEQKKDNEVEPNLLGEDLEQNEILKDVSTDKRKFYSNIPFTATSLLIANKQIADAYMSNGKIYFDELKEYNESKLNLTTLLGRYTNTIHEPEALFYLSKNATELGDTAEAKRYATTIAVRFPETLFNNVLNAVAINEDNADADAIHKYEQMYESFKSEKFSTALSLKKEIDIEYPGSSIQGKVDYLYALTIGKTKGREAYLNELKVVQEAYAGNEIGDIAAYTIRLLTTETSSSSSTIFSAEDGMFFYAISGTTADPSKVEVQLTEYNERFFPGRKMIVHSMIFGDKQLYYIKQFESQKLALDYHQEMEQNKVFLKDAGLSGANFYALTESNFKTLVTSSKEAEYILFFNQKYK